MLIATASLAQEYNGPFVPYRKANLWGYADTLGTIKIIPVYDKVSDNAITSMGLGDKYIAYKAGKAGVIDNLGNTVIPFEYDSLAILETGRYDTKADKIFYGAAGPKMYLMDIAGNREELQKMPYIEAGNISNTKTIYQYKETVVSQGMVAKAIKDPTIKQKDTYKYKVSNLFFRLGNGYFIIDTESSLIGTINSASSYILPPVYDKLMLFEGQEDLMAVYKGKKVGLYSINNRIMQLEPIYDTIQCIYDNNRVMFVLVANNKSGIFYDRGWSFFKARYRYIEPAHDSYCGSIRLSNQNMAGAFEIYKFINNGKTCYVGHNGVKFFED